MTYVVAGVSGNTGRVVAETLLAAGKSVRVIVRDVAKGEPWKARGAEVAVASLSDADALTHALKGASGAYLLVPPDAGAADFLAGQRATVDAIVAATSSAGVPHVVLLSSVGANLPGGTGPIRTLEYAERRLRGVSGVAFSFLRAPYFMENLGSSLGGIADGVYATFLDATRALPMVATQDIGRAAAELLLEGAKATHVVELIGVPVTPAAAAKTFGALAGRELLLDVAPTSVMADVLTGFGFQRDLAALYAEMTEGLNAGRIEHEGGHAQVRATTPLEVVAKKLLTPAS